VEAKTVCALLNIPVLTFPPPTYCNYLLILNWPRSWLGLCWINFWNVVTLCLSKCIPNKTFSN